VKRSGKTQELIGPIGKLRRKLSFVNRAKCLLFKEAPFRDKLERLPAVTLIQYLLARLTEGCSTLTVGSLFALKYKTRAEKCQTL
jgi:hypothetical protein